MPLYVLEKLIQSSLNDLKKEYGISHRFSDDLSKISLNYDQFLARSGCKISGQCRGLIIRPKIPYDTADANRIVGHCDIVAWPLNRFYNHGDPSAAWLDWDDVGLTVFEKLDGTCTILYWDEVKREWHVGTRAVPEADIVMNDEGLTFRRLFEIAADNTCGGFENLVNDCDKEITYVFELTAPQNKIHVRYNRPELTLLMMRNVVTGEEIVPENTAHCQRVPRCPQLTNLHTLEDVVEFVNSRLASELEGVVFRMSNLERVKLKSLEYTISSRMSDSIKSGCADLIELIIDNKIDDVLPNLEASIRQTIESYIEKIHVYNVEVTREFERIVSESDDPRGRIELIKTSNYWTSALFAINNNHAESFIDWVRKSSNKKAICRQIRDKIVLKH